MKEKNREPRYNLGLIITFSIICGILFTVAVTFIALSVWYVTTFNMEFKALLYTLTSPTEGTGGGTIKEIIWACVPCAILGAAVYTVCAVIIARKKPVFAILRRVGAAVCVVALIGSAIATVYSFRIPKYLRTYGQNTDLYDRYFTDPNSVSITSKGKTKNLIYIYLESMENSFASIDLGGYQDGVNYIPGLTSLIKEGISFSDKAEGLMGGFYAIDGATSWTMAALLATSSGIPFSFPVGSNSMAQMAEFAPDLITIGDILEAKGYTQEFLCGSDATFGGRRNYFTQHGNYKIFDIFTAREKGYISKNYDNGFWGYEDKYLFQIAKDELTALAAGDKPFNFTMLTVDTHYPKGYECSECENTYDPDETYDGQLKNALNCSDRMLTEFISWCKQQPFYKDTVIVISGDHPIMGSNKLELVEDVTGMRTMYNCILNTDTVPASGATVNRSFCGMDMFPTTLAAMGFNIQGDRLALGTNMFSGEQTLSEILGAENFAGEVVKHSDYYDRLTGFAREEEELPEETQ